MCQVFFQLSGKFTNFVNDMKFVSARELASVFYENQEQWNMIELGLAD